MNQEPHDFAGRFGLDFSMAVVAVPFILYLVRFCSSKSCKYRYQEPHVQYSYSSNNSPALLPPTPLPYVTNNRPHYRYCTCTVRTVTPHWGNEVLKSPFMYKRIFFLLSFYRYGSTGITSTVPYCTGTVLYLRKYRTGTVRAVHRMSGYNSLYVSAFPVLIDLEP